MRSAITFLNIQLSNSRVNRFVVSDNPLPHPNNPNVIHPIKIVTSFRFICFVLLFSMVCKYVLLLLLSFYKERR